MHWLLVVVHKTNLPIRCFPSQQNHSNMWHVRVGSGSSQGMHPALQCAYICTRRYPWCRASKETENEREDDYCRRVWPKSTNTTSLRWQAPSTHSQPLWEPLQRGNTKAYSQSLNQWLWRPDTEVRPSQRSAVLQVWHLSHKTPAGPANGP